MSRRPLALLLVLPVFALGACGDKPVNTAAYTCGQFNKSLQTKGDDTSGNFVNQLRKKAKLGQSAKVEHGEISLAIFAACRGRPASTRPAQAALKFAAEMKAGKFRLPPRTPPKKRSKK